MKREQFDEMIRLLRDGYEAGALRHVEFKYPGAGTEVYPSMMAQLTFSARPSHTAYQWIWNTLDRVRRILS